VALVPSRCSGFTIIQIDGIIGQPRSSSARCSTWRGLLIYCSDYKCSHLVTISSDRWPDDLRLSDLERRFVCSAYGKRGADVRPDFNWNRKPAPAIGFAMLHF
jgi:hypothetical protein